MFWLRGSGFRFRFGLKGLGLVPDRFVISYGSVNTPSFEMLVPVLLLRISARTV